MSGINASMHEETRESLNRKVAAKMKPTPTLYSWRELFFSLHKEGSNSWPSIITSKKRQSADKLESPVCKQMQKLEEAQKNKIIPTKTKLYFSLKKDNMYIVQYLNKFNKIYPSYPKS